MPSAANKEVLVMDKGFSGLIFRVLCSNYQVFFSKGIRQPKARKIENLPRK